jgi:hypothetical protein
MSKNVRSKRPVVTMRVSKEAFAALQARAVDGVKVAVLAEMYFNAGLEADGVDLPQVHRDTRAARAVAVKVMSAVGKAVNDTVSRLLAEENED